MCPDKKRINKNMMLMIKEQKKNRHEWFLTNFKYSLFVKMGHK
jgi:hypothetical protein